MVHNGPKVLRSGALARATGLSPDTIRYYEKIGVLPRASRTESGYRIYPANAVERVLVVQRALQIGFTLAELADVDGIAADIATLKKMHRSMKKVLSNWEQRIKRAGPGAKSHLLYSLTEAVKNAGDRPNNFRRRQR
jgi:DNA-binding transcriptional MerR regulator